MDPEGAVVSVPVERAGWRAMGSDVEVIIVAGPEGALDHARDRIARLERRWSRFLPHSEVSHLNHHAGEAVEVSADTVHLVRMAIEAWRESGGAVNPTVLGDVVRAGYDRSFDTMTDRSSAPTSSLGLVMCTDIEVDGSTVRLPAGTGFDPGGIGKGLAADIVTKELEAAGASGVCVNVGGDLRVSGTGPSGGGWTISIEEPVGRRVIVDVGLAEGAVATSTIARRCWRVGGALRHHLIDPSTGAPSDTDLVQATALAAECWRAETYAKAILLRGRARAFDILPAGVGALAVAADGTVITTDALGQHLGRGALPRHLIVEGT